MTITRGMLAGAALALLAAAYLRVSDAKRSVSAAQSNDPNIVWRIGTPDNSNDEFSSGSAPSFVFDVGKNAPGDWKQKQDAADNNPAVYQIRFALDQVPPAPVFAIDCFFLGAAPGSVIVDVNGKRGSYRLRPVAGENLDERQANTITFTRGAVRAAIPPSALRQGNNVIALSYLGDTGIVNYDALWLERGTTPAPDLSATVLPTIFFKQSGEQLKEVTDVVLHHIQPLAAGKVSLKVGAAAVDAKIDAGGFDFGERVVRVEVPAVNAPAPFELAVSGQGAPQTFKGEFRPEKRWKVFAGLKIHNDIGYTDLQPHVQELDNRNTDRALELMSKYPFFKFNLETSWLVDNFMHSRDAARRQALMSAAAADRMGINAMYLNLMSGMCTGEEMYRSLYYTKSLAKRYGVPMKFACLTDTPSHTWFTPSMLAENGVVGFALGSNQTRGALLQNSNLNEESPFWWEGIDGKRVVTWFARSYLQMWRLVGDSPSMDRLERTVPQFLARYRRPDYAVDAVLIYGLYTDNAAIKDGEVDIIKKWNDTYAYPKITPATDADYHDYITRNFAKKLPVYRGDGGAYWEDGAASTALETTLNRASQILLPQAETAAALATAFHPSELYPLDEFRDAWKNLLFYDEHTWGAHNSVSQPDRKFVTAQWEVKRSFAWRANWAATDLATRSLNRLVQNISINGPTMFVFNMEPQTRTGMVEFELDSNRRLVDPSTGAAVPVEVVRELRGYRVQRFLARDVPGFGYRTYRVERLPETPPPAPRPHQNSWQIESRYYRVTFDHQTGAIASIFDKELGRELADTGAPYKLNQLVYVSGGDKSRLMQAQAYYRPPQFDISSSYRASLIENNGKRIVVRAQARTVPEIETEVTVYDDLKRVDIVNRLRKEAVRDKEAVYFAYPFGVKPPVLAVQIQNTWVRPNVDQLPGACRDWFTTQNVVVARDQGAAIAWATPDAPLVTLTDINRGLWMKHLNVNNGHIYSYPMHNYWFTNYKADQSGNFTFRYAITSAAQLSPAELSRFDADTRRPLVGYEYYDTGNVKLTPVKRRMPEASGEFFKIDSAHATVASFKQAEDGRGYILRLQETGGQKGVAKFSSPVFPLASVQLANGVEDGKAPLAVKNGAVEIPLQPWNYTTVRIAFAPAAAAPQAKK